MNLTDKVVIVTGAGSGIGAAVTLEALKEGACVAAVDRDKDKLEEVATNCEEATGKKPFTITAELTNQIEATEVINATVKRYGKIDVLVNSAGLGRLGMIEDDDALDALDHMIQINLKVAVHLTKLAIPYLSITKGNIVNISTVNSKKCDSGKWAYGAAKAALDNFSKNMAVHLAPRGIRVNTVNPGPVETGFLQNMGLDKEACEARKPVISGLTLLGRYSEAKEIADMVIFLASDKAVGVTGASFFVDNGFLIK